MQQLYRILKTRKSNGSSTGGSHCFIFVPAESKQTRPHIEKLIRNAEEIGFVFNKRFIWNKQVMGMGYNGRCQHESILFLSKGQRVKPFDLSIPDVLSVKRIPSKQRVHEAEKPVELMKKLVKFSTEEGDVVVDAFAGSGSTGIACLSLQRNSILIEKNPEYVNVIAERTIDAREPIQ